MTIVADGYVNQLDCGDYTMDTYNQLSSCTP